MEVGSVTLNSRRGAAASSGKAPRTVVLDRRRVLYTLLTVVLLLGFLSLPATAATYYVSPAGADANSCATAQSTTQSSQKLTISAGVACLSAGDTLYIRGGLYTGTVNSINSGATTVRGGKDFSTGAITVAAYPGEEVTIAVGGGATGNAITLTSAAQRYLVFDRLILDGSGMGSWAGGLYQGPGAAHIRFQNGEIKNAPGHGVNTSPEAGGDLQLLNNHIHHNGGRTTPQTHNVYLLTSDNLVEGNEIDHGAYFGITIYNADPSNPSRNIVRKNRVHDNCIYGTAEIGISGGSHNEVYDNVVYGSSRGYGIAVEFATPDSTIVANNTVVLSGGIRIGHDATATVVKNNIVRRTGNSGPGIIEDAGRDSIISDNFLADPMFVSVSALDFALSLASPAANAGAAVASRCC